MFVLQTINKAYLVRISKLCFEFLCHQIQRGLDIRHVTLLGLCLLRLDIKIFILLSIVNRSFDLYIMNRMQSINFNHWKFLRPSKSQMLNNMNPILLGAKFLYFILFYFKFCFLSSHRRKTHLHQWSSILKTHASAFIKIEMLLRRTNSNTVFLVLSKCPLLEGSHFGHL